MIKKEKKVIETAGARKPIRLTGNLHYYNKNKKTAFFR